MANYNPRSPYILGEEWVPIRNEDLVLDPFANSVERGYSFSLPATQAVNNVRFYINEFPPLFVRNQGYTANIYPRGQESESGPVGRVVIPCNSGSIDSTGSNVTTSPVGASVASCLYNPSSNYFINYQIGNGSTNALNLFYATNSYAQLLNGKRILGVNLLTGINVPTAATANPDNYAPTVAGWLSPMLTNDAQYAVSSADAFIIFRPLVTFQTPVDTRLLVRTRMGDLDVPYGNNGAVTAGSPNVSQWTYTELQRFESTAGAARLFMSYYANSLADAGAQVLILYSALEVFYCEERRVAFGSRNINGLRFVQARDPFQLGMNQIIMRNTSGTVNPSLGAGEYTVTLSEANTGDDFNVAFSPFETAKVNELRQLYEIPTLPGVQVNLPFPLDDQAVGTTFTKESTDLIVPLSLHLSTNVVIDESHSYGRQTAGQVYGSNFVSQDIKDVVPSVRTLFPNVRYYARRFGATSQPLVLCGTSPASGLLLPGTAGNYISTPDAAALDIVGDIELTVDVSMDSSVWNTGTPTFISKWDGGQRSYRLDLTGAGLIQLFWSTTGADTVSLTSTAAVPTNSSRLAIRATLDVNNGGGGSTATFYTAPSINGPWTQLGAPVIGAVTSIFASTAAVAVGARNSGTSGLFAGTVLAAEIRNGIAGTVVADPDFSAQAPGTTSFVDDAGRTWTISGTASIVGGVLSTTGTSCVQITPDEFDALDEILDGWKEVKLQFPSPPYLGASSFPNFRWTSNNEISGSRWEVLGASAYAASGIAQQMTINLQFGQVPTAQQLYASTYGTSTSGATVNQEWLPQLGPYVSGATADQSADVAVIFGQSIPAVSGFGVIGASQPVTGIGLNCGIDPCGIPTDILYNRFTWTPPVNTGGMSLPGLIGNNATTPDTASLDITGDLDLRAEVSMLDWTPNNNMAFISKWEPNSLINQFERSYMLSINTTGNLRIAYSTDGIDSTFVVSTAVITPPETNRLAVRATLDLDNGAAGNTATFYTAPTIDGPWTILGAPVVTAGVIASVHSGTAVVEIGTSVSGSTDLTKGTVHRAQILNGINGTLVANPNFGAQKIGTQEFTDSLGLTWTLHGELTDITSTGTLELQRMDSITEWATIMKSTAMGISGFSDFEARVGMDSSYRIRVNDLYGFSGAWSDTVTISTAAPGVSGSCLDDAHLMIFTTNERQDGGSNLAYSNTWEHEVVENFGFAEAGSTQLQPMYDRDFFTAFRPTERGGDQFSRTLLVNAAAISAPTLPGFTALSDMAWDSVSYICVRDEEGNRWFANVNVPNGVVRNRRRLYQAEIGIIEVTDTPSPVDP